MRWGEKLGTPRMSFVESVTTAPVLSRTVRVVRLCVALQYSVSGAGQHHQAKQRPRRGSKPARRALFNKRHLRRAEFFAPPRRFARAPFRLLAARLHLTARSTRR